MKQGTLNLLLMAILLGVLLPASQTVSAIPKEISSGAPSIVSYQGQVFVGGTGYTGTGYFKFAIVSGSGNTTYWSNDGISTAGDEPTQAVPLTVANGMFTVLLGDLNVTGMSQPLTVSALTSSDTYLRVWFSGTGTNFQKLSPDRRIASVPYALQAGLAADSQHANEADHAVDSTHAGEADHAVDSTHAGDADHAVDSDHAGGADWAVTAQQADDANTVGGHPASDFLVPSGSVALGYPNDAALAAAGYVPVGVSNVQIWGGMSTSNAPSGEDHATAIWTGTLMCVWGGDDGNLVTNTGGCYNPLADTWKKITTSGSPTSRTYHTAVWTGSRMCVWGGIKDIVIKSDSFLNSGGCYDPVNDSWSAIKPSSAPEGRSSHTAVWTGSLMCVWGGSTYSSPGLSNGGCYDPTLDAWSPIATDANTPVDRTEHTAVWTGQKMCIWGGGTNNGIATNTGGCYDPTGKIWSSISLVNVPSARAGHTAIWTGTEMCIWGGYGNGAMVQTGGCYNPEKDSWIEITGDGSVPDHRVNHSAVWTGSTMCIWGGSLAGSLEVEGSCYDPVTRNIIPIYTGPKSPSGRESQVAVWTGREMCIWGGNVLGIIANSGGCYVPNLALYQKQ